MNRDDPTLRAGKDCVILKATKLQHNFLSKPQDAAVIKVFLWQFV